MPVSVGWGYVIKWLRISWTLLLKKKKDRQARKNKDKGRLQVGTRTQPSREVVANAAAASVANADATAVAENEFSGVNSSSEDMGLSDSDISEDSHSNYCLTDMVNSMTGEYSDTELQESDADEGIIERFKKAKKF